MNSRDAVRLCMVGVSVALWSVPVRGLDCNLNGVDDACELDAQMCCSVGIDGEVCGGSFQSASPQFSPVGTQSFLQPLGDVPFAVGPVSFRVDARADLDATDEFIHVRVNGVLVGAAMIHGSLCSPSGEAEIIAISAADWNSIINDGTGRSAAAEVELCPVGPVDPNACAPSSSFMSVTVSYATAVDCNMNGTADWCDIAGGTSTDCAALDGSGPNGIPDECDLNSDNDSNPIVPDVCDPCPFDDPNDSDGDGACDSDDPCPLETIDDEDGDGVCFPQDVCPLDPRKSSDAGSCGCGNSEIDLDLDGVADCIDPVTGEGPRYVAIRPAQDPSASAAGPIALHLTSPDLGCFSGKFIDVGPVIDGETVGVLVDTPSYRTAAEWGTIHVTGLEIRPGTTYDVTYQSGGPTFPLGSSATPVYGDYTGGFDASEWLPPDGFANISDILACVTAANGDGTAPPFYRVDTFGLGGSCVPDHVITEDDCTTDAFSGGMFPCAPPGDDDDDGVCNPDDICPAGDDNADADLDTVPDACDLCPGSDDRVDCDGDQVPDDCDNCVDATGVCDGFNPDQADADGDGVGDPCDICANYDDNADADGDGVPDGCDACPGFDDTLDCDGDGVADDCDNCVNAAGICDGFNPNQTDADDDGVGAPCDECDNDPNKVAMDVCGCGEADIDLDNDGTLDCLDPVVGESPRYVGIRPAQSGATGSIALRVTSTDYPCVDKFVDFDAVVDGHQLGKLVDAPVYKDVNLWGTVHVTGVDIVPASSYDVSYEGDSSGVLGSTMTAVWGDVVGQASGCTWAPPDGFVNITDILAILNAANGDACAPEVYRVDLLGWLLVCGPDGRVDAFDAAAAQQAFTGAPAPCQTPGDADDDTVCDPDDVCPNGDDTADTDNDGIPDGCDNCPDTFGLDQTDADNDGFGVPCDLCDNDPNKVDPGFCGCGNSEIDLDQDGLADCIDPVTGEGPRYIAIRPDQDAAAVGAGAIALRLTSPDLVCFSGKYVDFDVVVDGKQVGRLVDNPVYYTAVAWGEIHVTGLDVLPGTAYDVSYEAPGQPGISLGISATPAYGDFAGSFDGVEWTPPDGIVNILDILVCVDGANGSAGAPVFYRLDSFGAGGDCLPNHVVDLSDCTTDAFEGNPFGCLPVDDIDGDGVCNAADNCPATANPLQEDGDTDGIGDACDVCPTDDLNDPDTDGVCDGVDNCPGMSNPDQEDDDQDGIGNVCDVCPADALNDADADGVCDGSDNCPGQYNPLQTDADNDGVGPPCDECDNNPALITPGLCMPPCSSTDIDLDSDGIRDCEDPVVAEGSRYLGVRPAQDPGAAGSSNRIALHVVSTDAAFDCLDKYVDFDVVQDGLQVGKLVADPVYRFVSDWGTVHVTGLDIVPAATYEVSYLDEFTGLGSPLDLPSTTPIWGDVVGELTNGEWSPPNGFVNILDILAVVDAQNGSPTAPPFYRADLLDWLGGCEPDHRALGFDPYAVVQGFEGTPYPCPLPADADGDGVCNTDDACPNDAPPEDRDGDGICNSDDICPDDAAPDHDRDGDGVCNFDDLCPDDADKTDPGICGCGNSDIDLDLDMVSDCHDPVVGESARYLALQPSQAMVLPGDNVALRLHAPGVPCWVDQYVDFDVVVDGFQVGKLVPNPVYRSVGDWGVVHVSGGDIVPNTLYEATYVEEVSGVEYQFGSSTTPIWGDVVGLFNGTEWSPPDGFVNFTDILAILNRQNGVPTAAPFYRLDLFGWLFNCGPDQFITVFDVYSAVEAFGGTPIPCPPPGDDDDDGVCDSVDICPGGDDSLDADADGVPDACDVCPGYDDNADCDGDGVADGCDNCVDATDTCDGFNPDQADADGDGVGDPCDICANSDDNADADGDGVPDGCDACPGFDDNLDCDGDGVADGCDNCVNATGTCDGYNPDQTDADSDGLGAPCDACDNDPDKIDPGVCGCGMSDIDLDLDTVSDCHDPVVGESARYLALQPSQAMVLPGENVALRLHAPGVPCWVDQYVDFDTVVDGFQVGKLVPNPVYKPVSGPGGWGVVHVTGGDIVPNTLYEATYAEELSGVEYLFGSSTTPIWGDVVGVLNGPEWSPPDGFVNITDVLAILDGQNGTATAPPFYRLDLLGWLLDCGPDQLITVFDVNAATEAFTGTAFPCPPPGDDDSDGVCNPEDICPGGDDNLDADGDGVPDACDACPGYDDNVDCDGDGVADDCDNCVDAAGTCDGFNPDQADADGDGVGDPCDICANHDDNVDADGDGVPDGCDTCPGFDDNLDCDGDGVADGCDNCVNATGTCDGYNPDQTDVDGDGVGTPCDACDSDAGKTDPGFCGCNMSDIDLDHDGIADCLDPVTGDGPRYVAVRPEQDSGAAAAGAIALRMVSPDYPCFSRYVDFDVVVDGVQVGKLVDQPVFRTAVQWGVVHVTGLDIAPATSYQVKFHEQGQPAVSMGITSTSNWGDVVGQFNGIEWTAPNGFVNIIDLTALASAASGDPAAPPFYRLDLLGVGGDCAPDQVIEQADIDATVDAFGGTLFPCPPPGDSDNDGVCDSADICPGGNDGLDGDGDGVPDACDACPGYDDNLDCDGDGVADGCDNCVNATGTCDGYNPDQADPDNDGVGAPCDACDTDPTKTDPGFCGCNMSEIDLDQDGIADCVDPVTGDGPRYIAVRPEQDAGAAAAGAIALRMVSPDYPCFSRYVDFDVIVDGVQVGKLVDQPVFKTAAQWGTVHVTDPDIRPATTYQVKYHEQGQSAVSLGISATSMWGDVVGHFDGVEWTPPDGFANLTDILAIVDGENGTSTAPPFYRLDLTGWLFNCDPDQFITVFDVNAASDAFGGTPFPCAPPSDSDGDGVCDSVDICPGGDDNLDADMDGVPDDCDECPGYDDNLDCDGDGVADGCDNCVNATGSCDGYNPDQTDADNDGVGAPCDACDTDPTKTDPGFCGCNMSEIDLDQDGIADCVDPVTGDGPRYIAVRPEQDAGAAAAGAIALRMVSPDYPCLSRYVDFDVIVDGVQVGKLVDQPVFKTAVQWGVVHVTGPDIAPATSYQVKYHEQGQPAVSMGISSTSKWGDVVGQFDGIEWTAPNGFVNITDLTALASAASGDPAAPPFYRLDLLGVGGDCAPDQVIEQADIDATTDAFGGAIFPCPVADGDADGDTVCDLDDACPGGDDTLDADLDGVPDACDICLGGDDTRDTDGDGVPDFCDVCPGSNDNLDTDADGVPNGCDNCPSIWNPNQADSDGNGVGDACDLGPILIREFRPS